MVVLDKFYYKLIDEFSNIHTKIIIGDKQYLAEVLTDDNGENLSVTYWSFKLCFQNDYVVECYERGLVAREYENWLEKLRLSFNRELNDEIENCQNQFERINLLTDYKLRFSELKSNYVTSNAVRDYIGEYLVLNDHIKTEFSEKKKINDKRKQEIESSFLLVQLNSIDKILETLNEKSRIIESYSGSNSNKLVLDKRNISPLEKIDLYQTALLFYYLNEVGVIKYASSNEIAPIVSQLTGHSKNTLRTMGFDKIIAIKSGLAGRKPFIELDPSLNIGKVKDVIIEILHKINDDLEKNKNSKK